MPAGKYDRKKRGHYKLHVVNRSWFKKGAISLRMGTGQCLEGDTICGFCGTTFHYVRKTAAHRIPKTCCREHRYLLTSKKLVGKQYKNTIRYPDKIKKQARHFIRHLVYKGIVKKLPCEICGSAGTESHHYKGYARENWLDVKWLCPKHHYEEHKNLRRTGKSLFL